ncbi:MAG TPA: SOS response-associated peptidase [Acidimicrobiales bacterium]|jgi:putative SOS response-associated peptidase YedK|nr:SOS response-associated peptidase [Acidimicrobiales bacterium]
MCGRYTSVTPARELARYFDVDEVETDDLGPRFNVAPTQEVYAVALHRGRRCLGALRWGLVPPWAEDPRTGARMINARAESLARRPAFRRAFALRRCLVPADGFYEWQTTTGGRQAWYLRPRDGRPLAFAGLWESWRGDSGGRSGARLVSAAIVTTRANEVLSPLHDRMPAVLAPPAWPAWLAPGEGDPDELGRLLAPAPPEVIEAIPVGPLVNKVANDGPDLVLPLPSRERV